MPRIADRLKAFDQATARQRRRQRKSCRVGTGDGRGWQRENLYVRTRDRTSPPERTG